MTGYLNFPLKIRLPEAGPYLLWFLLYLSEEVSSPSLDEPTSLADPPKSCSQADAVQKLPTCAAGQTLARPYSGPLLQLLPWATSGLRESP